MINRIINFKNLLTLFSIVIILALLPNVISNYYLALVISILMYVTLAMSWALFSDTTGYISLATAAFFGIGVYIMALLGFVLPYPVVIILAWIIGLLISLIIGLSTLRLKGIYFVIFSFGLSALLLNIVKWYEATYTGTVGRWVFQLPSLHVYYLLLFVAVVVFIIHWFIHKHSSFGYALKAIGQDEEVARSLGVNTTLFKILAFSISSSFMVMVGAIVTLRWFYIDPLIAFNPNISFMVVVMVLMGGSHKLYGPIIGTIPVVLLFEFLSGKYPYHFMMIIGLLFIVVIYLRNTEQTNLLDFIKKFNTIAKQRKEL